MSFSWDDLEIQIAKDEKKEQEKLAKQGLLEVENGCEDALKQRIAN
jgi:hypothetical protein